MEGGHEDGPPSTRNLYMVDEVISWPSSQFRCATSGADIYWEQVLSAMQKAQLDVQPDGLRPRSWTGMLIQEDADPGNGSGLGALAMARFGVMCSEDLSIGCPALPQYILQVPCQSNPAHALCSLGAEMAHGASRREESTIHT
eukprot:1932426-Rhodomonas_salina.1